MKLTELSQSQLMMLARIVIKNRPEVAKEILAPVLDRSKSETDLSKIAEFRALFSAVIERGMKKSDMDRLFIAVMVHLYHPEVHFVCTEDIRVKRGFLQHLSRATGQQGSNVSRFIRQAIEWEKIYAEFKESVLTIYTSIQNAYYQ